MGAVKLIQFSIDRGPVQFIRIYGPNGTCIKTDGETKSLKQLFGLLGSPDTLFIGWNTAYDLWHLYRLYHIYTNQSFGKPNERLVEPFKCKVLDLYLHALLKGPYAQFSFAERKGGRAVATVRRVPKVAQQYVADAVLAKLKPIVPGDVSVGEHAVKGSKDLVTLSFNTSVKRLGLKAHAEYWGYPVIKLADVWPLPKFEEKPWMPWWDERYAEVEAACDKVLDKTDGEFYTYAKNDIEYLWLAEDKLAGCAPDYNDTCTHIVAYTRYHGFDVSSDTLNKTVEFYQLELDKLREELEGIDLGSWQSKVAALKKLDPLVVRAKKEVLEAVAKSTSKAAPLAQKMVKYGPAKQKVDQALKVAESGRLCTSLRVIGTATGRMSGEGSFNVQGIGKPEVSPDGKTVGLREAIQVAAVGDFHQFELAIAASAWGDKQLQEDLTNGIDIHLATAVDCHPKLIGKIDYREAKKAKKDASHPLHAVVDKCRTECKRMVFGILYGCTAQKIADVFNVSIVEAGEILERFYKRYPGILAFKTNIEHSFCTADTVTWKRDSVSRMQDKETDLTGYTRQWAFEKTVASILWELGQSWKSTGLEGVVVRQSSKGPQTIDNACRSAFLGSAIAVQQAVYRQAANMKIQSTGAQLCKMLGAELWDLYHLPMLNVHDEWVFARCRWFNYKTVEAHSLDFVERYKSIVPHLRFDLGRAEKWSDK